MAKTDIKKKAAKKLQNEVKKEVKKEAKKKVKKVVKNEKAEREREEKNGAKQPSVIHQFIPFILFALALLVAVCLIGAELAEADMGIAGNFISMLFCGLFGIGAFLVPVILVYMGIIWWKSVEDHKVKSKLIFAAVSALLISAIINVILTYSDDPSFDIGGLWSAGVELVGGGLLGGLVSGVCVVLFKSIGALIILIACLLIFIMFLMNITPKNISTYIKYKKKLREEQKLLLMEKENSARFDEKEPEEEKKLDEKKDKPRVIVAPVHAEKENAPKTEEDRKALFRIQKKEQLR